MLAVLDKYHIDVGCHKYTYKPTVVEWWSSSLPVTITIETGQLESTGYFEIQVWFENENESENERSFVLQTSFRDKEVSKIFIHSLAGKDRFHSIELDYQDIEDVWTSSSYQDSVIILNEILSCLAGVALESQVAGDTDAYKAVEVGETLSHLIQAFQMNEIIDDANQILDLLKMLVEIDGFKYLIELQEDLDSCEISKVTDINEKTVVIVKEMLEKYLVDILKDMSICNADFGGEISDLELNVLYGVLVNTPLEKMAMDNDLDAKSVTKLLTKVYKKIEVEDRNSMIDLIDEGDHVNLIYLGSE